jgi:hypothetical protein
MHSLCTIILCGASGTIPVSFSLSLSLSLSAIDTNIHDARESAIAARAHRHIAWNWHDSGFGFQSTARRDKNCGAVQYSAMK